MLLLRASMGTVNVSSRFKKRSHLMPQQDLQVCCGRKQSHVAYMGITNLETGWGWGWRPLSSTFMMREANPYCPPLQLTPSLVPFITNTLQVLLRGCAVESNKVIADRPISKSVYWQHFFRLQRHIDFKGISPRRHLKSFNDKGSSHCMSVTSMKSYR